MIELIFSLDWNELIFNNSKDFPGIPVVKPPSFQRKGHAWVQFLGRELRSHMLFGVAKKNGKKNLPMICMHVEV